MVMSNYRDSYAHSLEKPAEFWLDAAANVSWSTPPHHAIDSSRAPLYGWFPDASSTLPITPWTDMWRLVAGTRRP